MSLPKEYVQNHWVLETKSVFDKLLLVQMILAAFAAYRRGMKRLSKNLYSYKELSVVTQSDN